MPCGSPRYAVLAPISKCCPPVQGRLPTRYSPVRHSCTGLPAGAFHPVHPFDLHVLGTPPAFILSQDQTLMFILRLAASLLLASFSFTVFGSVASLPRRPLNFLLPSFGPLRIFRVALLFICQGSSAFCIRRPSKVCLLPLLFLAGRFAYLAGNEIEYSTNIPKLSTLFLKFFQVFF